MMILRLTRDATQPQTYCTTGQLLVAGKLFHTIELPWLPFPAVQCGTKMESCIGVGRYKMEPRETEMRGHHWILSNPELGVYRYPQNIPPGVYARSLVLMHTANWAHELLGCIAPGLGSGMLAGELAVLNSRGAMRAIAELTLGEELELDIN